MYYSGYKYLLLVALTTISASIASSENDQINPDEVKNLPGLSYKPKFKQYSGYLTAPRGKRLHYWFVESQGKPEDDPVLLWLNGGPGCSSLDGFLTELGPFLINPDGKSLRTNPYSWNTFANVLFLESPAGVGFSYSVDKHYATDDDQVAEDNYAALLDFYHKYPQFKNNELYITGESYAGFYLPTLAEKILNKQNTSSRSSLRLKGMAIGNGFLDVFLNTHSSIYYSYYHGLFGDDTWRSLLKHCCQGPGDYECSFSTNVSALCSIEVLRVALIQYATGLNRYSIYRDCETHGPAMKQRYKFDGRLIIQPDKIPPEWLNYGGCLYEANQEAIEILKSSNLGHDLPCMNNTASIVWLNSEAVRDALHIPKDVQQWDVCSDIVSDNYKTIYNSMYDQIKQQVKQIRILIFNGDTDLVCNFLGDQWFVESLNLKVLRKWKVWKHDNQIAGYIKKFKNLDYVTVKGSGHMVPQWKPIQALDMLRNWLYGS